MCVHFAHTLRKRELINLAQSTDFSNFLELKAAYC